MKLRTDDEKITLKVSEPVDAELVIVTASGMRPPKEAELSAVGLVSRSWLYNRRKSMVSMIGEDDRSEPLSTLRYFLEYLTDYTHDVPAEAIDAMRKILFP